MPSEIHALFDMHVAGVPSEVRGLVVGIIKNKNLTGWNTHGEIIHIGGNEFLLAHHGDAMAWLNNDCAWRYHVFSLGDAPWLNFVSFKEDRALTEFLVRWK